MKLRFVQPFCNRITENNLYQILAKDIAWFYDYVHQNSSKSALSMLYSTTTQYFVLKFGRDLRNNITKGLYKF